MNIIASNVDETRHLFYLKVKFFVLYTNALVMKINLKLDTRYTIYITR